MPNEQFSSPISPEELFFGGQAHQAHHRPGFLERASATAVSHRPGARLEERVSAMNRVTWQEGEERQERGERQLTRSKFDRPLQVWFSLVGIYLVNLSNCKPESGHPRRVRRTDAALFPKPPRCWSPLAMPRPSRTPPALASESSCDCARPGRSPRSRPARPVGGWWEEPVGAFAAGHVAFGAEMGVECIGT